MTNIIEFPLYFEHDEEGNPTSKSCMAFWKWIATYKSPSSITKDTDMANILPLTNGNLAKATLAAQEWLTETFPVFRPPASPDWPNPMPLQLGIYELILSLAPENISPAGVKNFLMTYTSTMEYHQMIMESTHRFDLQAQPSMPITEEDRDYSRRQLNPTMTDPEPYE